MPQHYKLVVHLYMDKVTMVEMVAHQQAVAVVAVELEVQDLALQALPE
jgi:hypothetical protein